MIDIQKEELVSLAEAAASMPCGRKERSPDVKTLYAWTKNGCRGVVLESVQIGGRRCTSKEAICRFIESLTAQAALPQCRNGKRADDVRQKELEAELDRLGVK